MTDSSMDADHTDSTKSEASTKPKGGSLFGNVAKHSIIYGLGTLMFRAVSFFMLPLYTRYLTPADYGVMALIEMTLDVISIIGGAQIALGVFRFYHKVDDEESRHRVVATSFLLVSMMYTLLGMCVFPAATFLSSMLFGTAEHAPVIRIAALNLGASSLLIIPMAFARVKDYSLLYVGVSLAKLLVVVGFNIFFLVKVETGLIGIFYSSLIANLLVGGFLAVWVIRVAGMNPSMQWTSHLLRYGLPLVAMEVATFLATFSDRYFLQAAADESVVGLYNLAYQFGFLMVSVGFYPIHMIWGPKRFQVAREANADAIMARAFVLINVVLLSTAVGVSLYVADVLYIMATPAFHPAARVVPVILVAYVLQSWAVVQDIGILIKEQTKYLTIANWIAAVVAVAGYALLIPRYFEWGAAIATVIAFGTRAVLTYRFSQRLWPIRYRWAPVVTLCVWSVTIAGIGLLLPRMHILASLGLRTGLVLVFFTGVWLLPILEASDRDVARATLARVLSRR